MSAFRLKNIICAAIFGLGTLALAAPSMAHGASGEAQPRCELAFETVPEVWLVQYDPLAQSVATRQFDLVMVNRGEGPCTSVIDFDLRGDSLGMTSPGSSTSLSYTIISEDGPRDVTPRAGGRNSAETKPFNLGAGERIRLRFTLTIAVSNLVTAGRYTQTAYLRASHPGGTLWAERPVTFSVDVAPSALMGLKGEFTRSNGMALIDLGVLTEGSKALNATLYVHSTTNYAVSVSSANSGRLRQAQTNWYIPYTLQVGQHSLDLSQLRQWDIVTTQPRYDEYPLGINLRSVAGRRAGKYSDVVTFTVMAF